MTTKELDYLSDTLKSEQTLIKKYQDYNQVIKNEQLRNACTDAVKRHQEHYSQLVEQLNQ